MRSAVILVTLFAAALASGGPLAAEPKQYAYAFLQGRITDGDRGRPLVGATVRLTTDAGTFESITDSRGSFVFEKLPIERFDLEIVSATGHVLRGIRQLDSTDPDGLRVEILLGNDRSGRRKARGPQQLIVVPAGDQQLGLVGPSPAADWRRLRRQILIFAGAAGVLAL